MFSRVRVNFLTIDAERELRIFFSQRLAVCLEDQLRLYVRITSRRKLQEESVSVRPAVCRTMV